MYRINYFSSYKNIHQIYQHTSGNYLYLGDYSAALDLKMLKSKNIKAGNIYYHHSFNNSRRTTIKLSNFRN
jgi:hypothetical protein